MSLIKWQIMVKYKSTQLIEMAFFNGRLGQLEVISS